MPGLSAKVFRTYNASFTMSTLLKELKNTNISIQEKVKLYNDCNRKVAILCNHKRTVGASHEVQMEKMSDRVRLFKTKIIGDFSDKFNRSKALNTSNGA
jgi:DNA topoisomerase-1